MVAATRGERIAQRARNPKWQHAPFRIEMAECINCDTCLRHCPPQFGAIFNHGIDVIILEPGAYPTTAMARRMLPKNNHVATEYAEAILREPIGETLAAIERATTHN